MNANFYIPKNLEENSKKFSYFLILAGANSATEKRALTI